MDSRFLPLFDGKRGWERNPHTYTPQDNAVHIADTDDHWEWWYYDFSFDNGYKAVATFHYHNIFLIPHVPTMQLFVYPPNAPPESRLWSLRPGQENSAARDRCRIQMGDLWAEDIGDGYRLVMDMKGLGLDVAVENVVPGWKAGTGLLYTDGTSEAGWVIAVPRGRVQGTLMVHGQAMPVAGLAYHDHNWGTLEMEGQFKGWYWGRIFDPIYTLVYGWVMPRKSNRPIVSPFMLAKGPDLVLSTDQFTLEVEEARKATQYGWSVPMRLRVRCQGPDVSVDGVLTAERIVEALELPRGESAYHYYRFLSSYTADIKVDRQHDRVSGETLHEMMILE